MIDNVSTLFFSIVMCTDHIDDYFWLAVESILKQTYSDFEFIIVANGSKDLESNFLSHNLQDNRIVFKHTSIRQLSFNLNYGINIARGKYIVRMDADDISVPYRLERLFSYCTQFFPDVIGSWATLIDKDGNQIGDRKQPTDNAHIRRRLPYNCPFLHPSVAIKKETLMEVCGYLGDIHGQDYDLWLRISRNKKYVFMNIPEYLLAYRFHDLHRRKRVISAVVPVVYIFREFLLRPSFPFFFALFCRLRQYLRYCIVEKVKAVLRNFNLYKSQN